MTGVSLIERILSNSLDPCFERMTAFGLVKSVAIAALSSIPHREVCVRVSDRRGYSRIAMLLHRFGRHPVTERIVQKSLARRGLIRYS
jgi:hypothetical protein